MTYSDLFKRDIPPLNERIGAAIDRVTNGQGSMRIPADPTDPDIVLGDCRESIAALSARVAKLEAALGFYAEPSGYLLGLRFRPVVVDDGGMRARAALEDKS